MFDILLSMEDKKLLKKELIKHDEVEMLIKGKGLSQMLSKRKCESCQFSLADISYESRPSMMIREHIECEECGYEQEELYCLS